MNKLNKPITIDGNETTLLQYFKDVLTVSLIESPEKRLMGDSDWIDQLKTGMAKAGILEGGVNPCCEAEDYCDAENPCSFEAVADWEKFEECLRKCINELRLEDG